MEVYKEYNIYSYGDFNIEEFRQELIDEYLNSENNINAICSEENVKYVNSSEDKVLF